MEFDVVTEGREKETVWIALPEIVSIRQYQDRRAYGGYFDATELTLKNGKSFRVHGHVQKRIAEAMQPVRVHSRGEVS